MIRLLRRWYRARQRAIDVQILWPACCNVAPDVPTAREIFTSLAVNDAAWRELGAPEMLRQIAQLR